MDHLIHTLIIDMLPDYIARYDSQDMGFKGPNLARADHGCGSIRVTRGNTRRDPHPWVRVPAESHPCGSRY
jgi:hypothetical protein